jgi:hypothetical protein
MCGHGADRDTTTGDALLCLIYGCWREFVHIREIITSKAFKKLSPTGPILRLISYDRRGR